jgi:hypothetical protein
MDELHSVSLTSCAHFYLIVLDNTSACLLYALIQIFLRNNYTYT